MDLFFNFDGDPIANIFCNKEKFIIRAGFLADSCYYAEYLSSATSVVIIEKSFLIRVLGDEMRVFKNPTQKEFEALGKIYQQILIAEIMER